MEPLKRKRTQKRREFTVAAEAVERAIELKNLEILDGAFSLLAEIADNVLSIESAICDIWCESDTFDEKAFQVDQDKALEYRQRWLHLESKYKEVTNTSIPKAKSESSLRSESSVKSVVDVQSVAKRRVLNNMPKLELVKFDGNLKNWLLFWGGFKKIHEDNQLEDIDKFQFLMQAMVVGTSARQLVEAYPPSGENYHKAIQALKARFARDDLLIETYVRGLLNLVLMKQKGQANDLPSLYDSLQTHLQALETLGVAKDKYDSILFPMIESALPEDILRTWNRIRVRSDTRGDDLCKLIQFLREEVESEERIVLAREGFAQPSSSGSKQPTACFVSKSSTENSNHTTKRSTPLSCIWCDKDSHASSECHKAIKMSLKERQDFLWNKKACTICLKSNHISKRCKSFPKCLFCKKRHMTLMCVDLYGKNDVSDNDKKSASSDNDNNNLKSSNMLCQLKSTTLLQTFVVKICHGDKEVCTRALLDNGSQRSYVRKDLVQKLGLNPIRKETITHCVFGGIESKAEERFVYNLLLKSIVNEFNCVISVLEQNQICGFLPRVTTSVIKQLHLKSISLTDTSDCPDEIGVLIGADFSGLLLTGEILHLDNNLTAIKTKMGWTVQGPVTGVYSSFVSMTTTLQALAKIDISDLWSLESLGIRDPSEQVSKLDHEREVLSYFNKTIVVNSENRYEVCLPWRINMPRPQSNYNIAKKRLMSTTARLESLGKVGDYDAVLQEWSKLDIIELAPNQFDKDHGMFLPHHAVIKESSLTTKIRPVFDASAKDGNGLSLNACLEKGSNLIELIPELLIDFRKEAIGVTADIAKAFLQISLNSEDRNYLKFLWWSDVNDKGKGIATYRHRRVVFGVRSSLFHLAATINYHLDHSQPQFMETAKKLKKSFYVDNCVTSVKCVDSMNKFIDEAKDVMNLGGFDLRCWVTAPECVKDQPKTVSVLGLIWDTESDTLNCNVNIITGPESETGQVTKRTLLSVAQRVFDPLGFCCPVTIIPKMLLQKAWIQKLKWDDELPIELRKQYQEWLKDINLINEIKIPRTLTRVDISKCLNSLHVFCDASINAYSTCIFLRSEYDGTVNVSFVMAKSRVTPLKNITIPRLELIAATLATRLSTNVIKSLNLPKCPVYYWTDSTVVLSWLRGDGEWSVFVANRVREIKESSAIEAWRHVPGSLNPADVPSRGINIKKYLESCWWQGPSWLYYQPEKWPTSAELTVDITQVNEERKKSMVNVVLEKDKTFLDRFIYFSKYTKIVRMTSWILRLKYKLNRRNDELNLDEVEFAEKILFRLIQSMYKNKLEKMQTFTDEFGLARLETKLCLTNKSFDFKSPVVLPSSCIIVQRLVEERHRILNHAGSQTLMANIRETLWVIGIRKLVKKVVRECVICKRFKTKALQTHRASLPKARVEASAAFEICGVDLAGPLVLRTGLKCWIVLFTCATYRAVHFEVTESLSTADFIMCLRRFIARRGRVREIFSDNGTNFTGFNNCLKGIDWNKILCFSTVARIKWNFIPPGAPWWGGFYERLVGVMKDMLKRVLGRASITLMELQTVLCDCEATINSRPLSYMSNSKEELKPITPSMFIQPIAEHCVPDIDDIDGKTLNVRANYCQKLREDFRHRFRTEYVSHLIQKGKQRPESEVRIGDVVLLETEDKKRINWPLALVTDIYVGADGHSRVAKVRTATGERTRPLQRLYSLEINSNQTLDLTPDSTPDSASVDNQDKPDLVRDSKPTVTRSGRTVKVPNRFGDSC